MPPKKSKGFSFFFIESMQCWLRKGRVGCLLGVRREGKSDRDGCSQTGAGAAGSGITAMLARDVANQKKAETSALNLCHGASGNAIEAIKDAFELFRVEADAGVRDGQGDPGVAGDG